MAASIQIVGDQIEIVNDLDLLTVLMLLFRTASESPDRFASLEPFFIRWKAQCQNYGPGVLDLELAQIALDATTRQEMITLMSAAEIALHSFAGTIPKSFFNSSCLPRGIVVRDYPTSGISAAIQKLRRLLA